LITWVWSGKEEEGEGGEGGRREEFLGLSGCIKKQEKEGRGREGGVPWTDIPFVDNLGMWRRRGRGGVERRRRETEGSVPWADNPFVDNLVV
jgi:hypothetical protein